MRIIDKLTRSFLETSSPHVPVNIFNDVQDPTYMSFKLNFFPVGMNFEDYSTAGLFKPSTSESHEDSVMFLDNAHDYLKNIGSPTRQAYHRAFSSLLYKIQEEAPWYFQSIGGLSELYKIDPTNNFRGKDKTIIIDCLESVDLRMSYLADLYRNMVFDSVLMKEILPINLRTFNMQVYVLEFRRFNTTFGAIADFFAGRDSTEQHQKTRAVDASNSYVSPQGSGLFDNIARVGTNIINAYGGVNGIFGIDDKSNYGDLKSAFEAASIHIFNLKNCEFDFFEAPPYLDSVSVSDNSNPATFRFKIHINRIEKTGAYPFFNFIIAEHIQNTMFNKEYLGKLHIPIQNYPLDLSEPYLERYNTKELTNERLIKEFKELREFIYPSDSADPDTALAQSYVKYERECAALRVNPLERSLQNIVNRSSSRLRDIVNKRIGEMTGGVVGATPLGNIYGKSALMDRIEKGVNDFIRF